MRLVLSLLVLSLLMCDSKDIGVIESQGIIYNNGSKFRTGNKSPRYLGNQQLDTNLTLFLELDNGKTYTIGCNRALSFGVINVFGKFVFMYNIGKTVEITAGKNNEIEHIKLIADIKE